MAHRGRLKDWVYSLQDVLVHSRREHFFNSKECSQGRLSQFLGAQFRTGKGLHAFGMHLDLKEDARHTSKL